MKTVGLVSVLNRGQVAWELCRWMRTLPPNVATDGPRGTQIAFQRNWAAHQVITRDLEWLLFIDSDCIPQTDCLPRLLGWRVDLVAGVVCERFPPFTPVVLRSKEPPTRWLLADLPKSGLEPIAAAGTGCLLIRRPVLEAMGDTWFQVGQIIPDLLLEDVGFCFRAKDLGFQPFVDCGVRVGHIGGGIIWPGLNGHPYMEWHGGKVQRTERADLIPVGEALTLGVECWP
jgi:hypothetical protein